MEKQFEQVIKETKLFESKQQMNEQPSKDRKLSEGDFVQMLQGRTYDFALTVIDQMHRQMQKAGVPMSSGAYENWLDKKGLIVLDDEDVAEMDEQELSSILSNIFYNNLGLKRLVPDDILRNMLQRLDRMLGRGEMEKDWVDGLQNASNARPAFNTMLADILKKHDIEGAL